jgi:hypothetical protein
MVDDAMRQLCSMFPKELGGDEAAKRLVKQLASAAEMKQGDAECEKSTAGLLLELWSRAFPPEQPSTCASAAAALDALPAGVRGALLRAATAAAAAALPGGAAALRGLLEAAAPAALQDGGWTVSFGDALAGRVCVYVCHHS